MFWLVRLKGKDDKGNWIFSEPMSPLKALRYDKDTFQLVYDLMTTLLEKEEQINAGQMDLFSGRPVDEVA